MNFLYFRLAVHVQWQHTAIQKERRRLNKSINILTQLSVHCSKAKMVAAPSIAGTIEVRILNIEPFTCVCRGNAFDTGRGRIKKSAYPNLLSPATAHHTARCAPYGTVRMAPLGNSQGCHGVTLQQSYPLHGLPITPVPRLVPLHPSLSSFYPLAPVCPPPLLLLLLPDSFLSVGLKIMLS